MLAFNNLIFLAAFFGFARSWDVAVTTSDKKLHFYHSNGSGILSQYLLANENADLSVLTYDAATDLLLLVDENHPADTIFRVLPISDTIQPLVRKQEGIVRSVAFDPVTKNVFWIAAATNVVRGAIYRMSLADSENNGYGKPVLKQNGAFTSLAVDSCEGYIYWSEFALSASVIKRAKFDGSNESKVVESELEAPTGLAVDVSARRLYWVDDSVGVHYKIESSDLDGGNRRTLARESNQQPKHIAVGDENIFWSDELKRIIWFIPKNATEDMKPRKFVDYGSIQGNEEIPKGLTVKYTMSKQLNGIPECNALKNTANWPAQLSAKIEESLKKRDNPAIQFWHKATEPSFVPFLPVDVSQKVTTIIEPQKNTENVVPNERSVVDNDTPQNLKPTEDNIATSSTSERSIVSNKNPQLFMPTKINEDVHKFTTEKELGANDGFFVEQSGCASNELDVRDPIIMVLGTLCGLLCIACAVLITKIIHLRKRPRIKKRIIVNKNVTPLTARPEQQCEITIENCCNMNICETPCFEPRSTIRPSLLGAKAGKEEKKNLIANMEHPDDIY